jgi:4-hydroxybenzoate polyprenyltransferase
MPIKPYLQLVRVPNVITAAADSLAGWLLVGGSFTAPAEWLPLVGASMAIYAGGIVLNDLADYRIDLAERPGRPLPSGRVGRRTALGLAAVLVGTGIALAALSGQRESIAVAILLVASVLLYDLLAKRSWLGPAVMGTCRGLNLLLGMSHALPALGPAWLAAVSMAVFVAGVTWISRSEVGGGSSRGLIAGWIMQNVALLGLVATSLQAVRFPGSATGSRPIVPLEGLLVLLVVAWWINSATGTAVRDPSPGRIQRAVKTGVLSLVWLNVGLVAAVRGPIPAVAVAGLSVPSYLAARWITVT